MHERTDGRIDIARDRWQCPGREAKDPKKKTARKKPKPTTEERISTSNHHLRSCYTTRKSIQRPCLRPCHLYHPTPSAGKVMLVDFMPASQLPPSLPPFLPTTHGPIPVLPLGSIACLPSSPGELRQDRHRSMCSATKQGRRGRVFSALRYVALRARFWISPRLR